MLQCGDFFMFKICRSLMLQKKDLINLPSYSNISKTLRVNTGFTALFKTIFDKLSYDIQVGIFGICSSLVIDV